MTHEDRANFGTLLSATMQTYSHDITPDMISVWWGVLRQYDFDAVRAALSAHVSDREFGRFLPKPADIVGRLFKRPESNVPRLGYKKTAPDYKTWQRIEAQLKRRRPDEQWWMPERVKNQRQVDFIVLQARHFGERSRAGEFLQQCQAAGIITNDYQLGALNMREPGQDDEEVEGIPA